jgi:succinate dehydrogenase / fumarate reductase iron-sulfur subunit
MTADTPKEVHYRIRRFEPDKDTHPHWEDYRIPFTSGMTVLEGLWQLKETQAPGLAWRASCRMGVCGSCGMLINGRARLACNTQVSELGTTEVIVAPLPNFDIIRDLVPDLLLHQVWLLHGVVPHARRRRPLRRTDAAGPGTSLQRGQPR